MQLFPVMKEVEFPICQGCNGPIMGYPPECCCGLPEEDPKNTSYINHCWNCGTKIDSACCVESSTPGMGYHCKLCGEDLTKWKRNMGLIPV